MAENTRGGRLALELLREFGLLGGTKFRVEESIIPVAIVSDMADKARGVRFNFSRTTSPTAGNFATVGIINRDGTAGKLEGSVVEIDELYVGGSAGAGQTFYISGVVDESIADVATFLGGAKIQVIASDGYRIKPGELGAGLYPGAAAAQTCVTDTAADLTATFTISSIVGGGAWQYVRTKYRFALSQRQCVMVSSRTVTVSVGIYGRGTLWLP